MDLVEYYYEIKYGIYPFSDEAPKIKTKKTIDYLYDIGYTENEIIRIIEEVNANDSLTYDDLPEDLWKDSLLKKNVFYFHNQLQITSKAPTYNPKTMSFSSEPFYLEMKIRYSLDDALDYFYKKNNVEEFYKNKKRDIGAIQFLLEQYKKIDLIEPIDFLLFLIDYASDNDEGVIDNILNVDNKYRSEAYEYLKPRFTQAKAMGINKIIFR